MKKEYEFSPASPQKKQFGFESNFGFSLVELIIVIAIMAILAAALAPALIRYIAKSRKASDIETADVIWGAISYAYGEAYSYEGTENGVVQDADFQAPTYANVSCGDESYKLEIISFATDNNTFQSDVDQHIHFLSLVRKDLGKESSDVKTFSQPKFTQDSGNGCPEGFLIGRKLNDDDKPERFEVWLCDSSGTPLYRLEPDCCTEYK